VAEFLSFLLASAFRLNCRLEVRKPTFVSSSCTLQGARRDDSKKDEGLAHLRNGPAALAGSGERQSTALRQPPPSKPRDVLRAASTRSFFQTIELEAGASRVCRDKGRSRVAGRNRSAPADSWPGIGRLRDPVPAAPPDFVSKAAVARNREFRSIPRRRYLH